MSYRPTFAKIAANVLDQFPEDMINSLSALDFFKLLTVAEKELIEEHKRQLERHDEDFFSDIGNTQFSEF